MTALLKQAKSKMEPLKPAILRTTLSKRVKSKTELVEPKMELLKPAILKTALSKQVKSKTES